MESAIFSFERTEYIPIIDVEILGNFQSVKLKALLDTGCNVTSIYHNIAIDMRLQSYGTIPMSGMTDPWESPIHKISMVIGGTVHIPTINIAEFPVARDGIDMVIGTDVLSLCDMAITNVNGFTKIRISHPSGSDQDFSRI